MSELLEDLNDRLYRACLRKYRVVHVHPAELKMELPLPGTVLDTHHSEYKPIPRLLYGNPAMTFDDALDTWVTVSDLMSRYKGREGVIEAIGDVAPKIVKMNGKDTVLHLLARFLVAASWTPGSIIGVTKSTITVRSSDKRSLVLDGICLGHNSGKGKGKVLYPILSRDTLGMPHYGFMTRKLPGITVELRLWESAVVRYLTDTFPETRREIDTLYAAAMHLGRDVAKRLGARFPRITEEDAAQRKELASLLELSNLIGRKT